MYLIMNFFVPRTFTIQSSISGLLILKHELEFLGLFDVDERGSARQYIPAKKVSLIGLSTYNYSLLL